MFAVVLVLVWGAVRRGLRRLLRRPARIWFGPAPLHATRHTAAATQRAGYPTRSVVTSTKTSKYALVTSRDFDRVVGEPEVSWDSRHWHALFDLLLHGDIWVAYFDSHFFPLSQRRANEMVFVLLRAAGIRIVVITHGSDIVQLVPQRTRFNWIERMQLDYPTWDFAEQTRRSRERIRLFTRYAHLVIAPYPAIRRLLPKADLTFTPFSMDGHEIPEAAQPGNQVPLILHAPNHRNVKGTAELVAAVERLKARGIACELRLVEGVPRDEALLLYGAADVIVDQLIIGAFGVFAPEAMAIGRPVVTYLDQEILGDPVFNFPLVNANPESIERVLSVLVQVPELRTRLGRASRDSVERYLSPEAMAQVWDRICRHVWKGEPLRLEGTVHFSAERKPRVFTEDPAEEAFWPIDASDLMPQILASLE